MWSEFKTFLVKQNVLALAIAVVIGTALAKVVSALVADLIMPIATFAIPGGEWRAAVVPMGPIRLSVGDFAGAVVDFIIIGFITWRISKALIKPPPAGAPTKSCPYCRMTLDAAATKCAYCTSELAG